MEESSKSLITVNSSLAKIEKQIAIGERIIEKRIKELFNRAFQLINSRDIKYSDKNYYFEFTNDQDYFKNTKFKYVAITKKEYFEVLKLLDEIIDLNNKFLLAYFLKSIVLAKFFRIDDLLHNYYFLKQFDKKNQFLYKERNIKYENKVIFNIKMYKKYLKIAVEMNYLEALMVFGNIYTALIFELLLINQFTEANIKIADCSKFHLPKFFEPSGHNTPAVADRLIYSILENVLIKNILLGSEIHKFLKLFDFELRKIDYQFDDILVDEYTFLYVIDEDFQRYGWINDETFPNIAVVDHLSNHLLLKNKDISKNTIVFSNAPISYRDKIIRDVFDTSDLSIVVILEIESNYEIFDNEFDKIVLNSGEHSIHLEIINKIEVKNSDIIKSEKISSVNNSLEFIVTISKSNGIYDISIVAKYENQIIKIEYTNDLTNLIDYN